MDNEFIDVKSSGGVIKVSGDLRLSTLDAVMSKIYQAVTIARYPDIRLDFSNLNSITNSVMPPLAAFLRLQTAKDKIEFEYTPPSNQNLAKRLSNSGLAHYIDFRKFNKPKIKSPKPTLMQYLDNAECNEVSDTIINHVLRTAQLDRKNIAALEWVINEITDNVINHSLSKIGGFAIYHKIPNTNIIEFTVADAGVGIARTLGLTDEREAVELAVQEGVTKDKSKNQGNGLYGTFKLACGSAGLFNLRSKKGILYVSKDGETHTRLNNVPFPGTMVMCQIDCDQPDLIERAFVFNGRAHTPQFDYVERLHEDTNQDITIKASAICATFGSRESGKEANIYINNMIRSMEGKKITIDFDGVSVISSSFADEVFGRLFVALGPMRYMRTIEIMNSNSIIESLIDRAISMRAKTG